MNEQLLETTAKYLVSAGRGILAADESTTSANKRFAAVGVVETEENRRIYRQLLITTPAAKDALSGVIFYDETFWQIIDSGKSFHDHCAENGIIPGIKLDEGLVDLPGFPGEKISKGLDTLPERIIKYRDAGAKFAKWRSVITIAHMTNAVGEVFSIPTEECINANAFVLARYARICQDFDIVPIVEPEVLFDGKHTAQECEDVLARVLSALFVAMRAYHVYLPGAILKTSMVLPGKDSGIAIDAADVADRTVRVLREYVPAELGGVVFLSGGQSAADGLKNLNAIVQVGRESTLPWGLTFSYSRALQDPVLKHWAGTQSDVLGAQAIFARQLEMAVLAREGKFVEGTTTENFVSVGQDL
jgi:fructose-bisphosphate aldolase class I